MDSKNQSKSTKGQSNGKSKTKKQQAVRFSEKNEGPLKEFFIEELKDIYFAENEILKGLKKMESGATSKALKESIKQHHSETQEQIKQLEKVFELADQKPAKKKCDGILGILKDGEGIIEDTEDDTMVRDAAIIIASQKVEHYEIASYGSLAELARTLGFNEGAEILEGILEQEKETDVSLTELAVESVNEEAKKED